MNWHDHSKLDGKHAFLGASKWHWINYDSEKLETVYRNTLAVEEGTKLHEFASNCIEMHQKLPRSEKTLNLFVNDAIGYKMMSELVLYYSENCFGTADAICYRNGVLRIHDLKTGKTPAHWEQLEIYAALFCLEYGVKPYDIKIILRIYQYDEITELEPDPEQIMEIIKKIMEFDKVITRINSGSEEYNE